MEREFWRVCRGFQFGDVKRKKVRNAEGLPDWVPQGDVKEPGSNIEKVKEIMSELTPGQLHKLLQWELGGMTALDWCLHNEDEECLVTIAEHAITAEMTKETRCFLFPYLAMIKSTNLISDILTNVQDGYRELLEAKTYRTKQTVLELCLENERIKHIVTIAEHMISNTIDPDPFSVLFPYTAYVTATNISARLLDSFPDQCKEWIQILDKESRSVLQIACDVGNQEVVLTLLDKMKHHGILKEELLRCDKTGRTALCLAQAERKQKWNKSNNEWEDAESDELYESRLATAKEMIAWIQNNSPDMVQEVQNR